MHLLIAQGDLIFTDSPLLFGPKMASAPVCLGCHHGAELSCPCPGCGWPLCSVNCANAPQHKDECAAMQKAGFTASFVDDETRRQLSEYACIIPLRFLLLSEEKKQQVRQLQSHLDVRRYTEIY